MKEKKIARHKKSIASEEIQQPSRWLSRWRRPYTEKRIVKRKDTPHTFKTSKRNLVNSIALLLQRKHRNRWRSENAWLTRANKQDCIRVVNNFARNGNEQRIVPQHLMRCNGNERTNSMQWQIQRNIYTFNGNVFSQIKLGIYYH